MSTLSERSLVRVVTEVPALPVEACMYYFWQWQGSHFLVLINSASENLPTVQLYLSELYVSKIGFLQSFIIVNVNERRGLQICTFSVLNAVLLSAATHQTTYPAEMHKPDYIVMIL